MIRQASGLRCCVSYLYAAEQKNIHLRKGIGDVCLIDVYGFGESRYRCITICRPDRPDRRRTESR